MPEARELFEAALNGLLVGQRGLASRYADLFGGDRERELYMQMIASPSKPPLR
jgi:hypothetical protein